MFEILFGWRKASKCKKLIRRVQCRLKLLKNKRNCIVNQFRNDVAQLIKYGLHQTAFQRVEQLIKDTNIVQVYDLLDQFCEFIIINLPYIRKHKDCPNDINEAISTLVFSSARFGELPELISIRKLFKERYGQRFVMVALELLPGNLVNHQIKEGLYMKKVADDDKYRLLDEIANSCIEPGPLLLEYKPEWQEEKATKHSNSILSCEVQIPNEAEPKIIPRDSTHDDISKQSSSIKMDKFTVYRHKSPQHESDESSSDISTQLPQELIYLDDIEEFVSPVSKDGNLQDQRLFKFKSFAIPSNEKPDNGIEKNKSFSISSTKMASRKRMRRRSLSQENRISTDTQCLTYYGAPNENSLDNKRKSHRHKRDRKNKSLEIVKKGRDNEETCSIKSPCYFYSRDENYSLEARYLRAMTMPNERPNESPIENIFRSNSYPFEQPRISGCSSSRHIHPKLPDYDELAAKFESLKKEKLQNEQQSRHRKF